MRQSRWTVFGVCAGLFIMSMLYRASNAVIAPGLIRDLGLGAEELGLLGAVFFYAFALAQLPLGLALDRIGSKPTMIFMNVIGLAGAVLFAFSRTPFEAIAGRFLLGLGMSANLMGPLALYTRWFTPREFATISGLMLAFGTLGGVLATTPLVLLAGLTGWRGSFLILALVNALLLTGLAFLIREAPPGWQADQDGNPNASKLSILKAGRYLFGNRSFWSISITSCLRYGVYASIQTLWAGPFFIVHLGLPEITAGNLLLALSMGFILGSPFGGILSDRLLKSRKKVVYISMSSMALSVLALSFWPGPKWLPLLALLMFFFGFMGSFGQIMFAQIKELMPTHMAGRAMTGINFFTMIGAGVFLMGLGELLGRGGGSGINGDADYRTAFFFCFLMLAASMGAYAFSRDTTGQNESPAGKQ